MGWDDVAVNKPSLAVLCSLSLIKVIIKTSFFLENGHPICYKMLVKVKEVVNKKTVT